MTDKDFKIVADATLEIERCINDKQYLCDRLNMIDKGVISDFFRKYDINDLVNGIRKQVCKILLLDNIDVSKLDQIIDNCTGREFNAYMFNSKPNAYKILNTLINSEYKEVDEIVLNITSDLISRVGDVSNKVWNLNGARNNGQSNYCIVLYNNSYSKLSTAIQLYIDFKNGVIDYGISKYVNDKSITIEGPFNFTTVDDFYKYIDDKKDIILLDIDPVSTQPKMTFIDAAKFILNEFDNTPMTSIEIWGEIDRRGLVDTNGKTPTDTLHSIILNNCVDSPVKSNKTKNIFIKVEDRPAKFVLNNYMSDSIKETMIKNGFITIDMLNDILAKHGIKND